jgi:hypothetical protein
MSGWFFPIILGGKIVQNYFPKILGEIVFHNLTSIKLIKLMF